MQIIHPFDTVYINEKEALIIIAKERGEVIGIASGVSLGSFYLNNSVVGNVFSSELIDQFKERGFYPNEILSLDARKPSPLGERVFTKLLSGNFKALQRQRKI